VVTKDVDIFYNI